MAVWCLSRRLRKHEMGLQYWYCVVCRLWRWHELRGWGILFAYRYVSQDSDFARLLFWMARYLRW